MLEPNFEEADGLGISTLKLEVPLVKTHQHLIFLGISTQMSQFM